jgi:hypothetical protein
VNPTTLAISAVQRYNSGFFEAMNDAREARGHLEPLSDSTMTDFDKRWRAAAFKVFDAGQLRKLGYSKENIERGNAQLGTSLKVCVFFSHLSFQCENFS